MDNLAAVLEAVNCDFLPPQVRRLVKIIGLEQTWRLLEARGGIPTYIPEFPDRAGVLKEILTLESIRKLVSDFGSGRVIETPKSDKIKEQVRNLAIDSDAAAGMNNVELARKWDLTRRQIINIRSRLHGEAAPDLFSS